MTVSEVFRVVGDAPTIGVKIEHQAYEDAVEEGKRLLESKVWKEFHVTKHFTKAPSEHGYVGGAVPDTNAPVANRPVTADDIGEALSKMDPAQVSKLRDMLSPQPSADTAGD